MPRSMRVALVVASVAVLVATLALAVVHVDDRYRVDHVSGARVALAQAYNDGILYPPIFDGERYGGTRFMPLPIVLHALAARVTGEYLVSGKLLAYGAGLALLGLLAFLLRRQGWPWAAVFGLIAMVLTARTVLGGVMGLRADVLPLVLQVAAVGLIGATRRTGIAVLAAGLAAAAVLSKLTAVWGPAAIVVWLVLRNDWRRLGWFVAATIAFTGAGVALFAAVSDGRMIENFTRFSVAGVGGVGAFVRAPYRAVHLGVQQALAAWILLPAVVGLAWWGLRSARASGARREGDQDPGPAVPLWSLSLAAYVVILMVVLTDVGTGWNQLVDLPVLVALALHWPETTSRQAMVVALGAALLWLNVTGLAVVLMPDVAQLGAARPAVPLSGLVTPGTRLLSDDAYVHVAHGQRPVVLDAFMVLRLAEREPVLVRPLIQQIERQDFEVVVLVQPLEGAEEGWWSDQHFGPRVREALLANYALLGRIDGYYVYQPLQAPIGARS